jgi:class 3 adenylate cyclase
LLDLQTRYATFRGDKIAYQVLGEGPDLVFLTGTLTHVDLRWQEPLHKDFLRRLASFSRLILLDPRGSGASDPIPLDPLPTWEDEVDDLLTVLDAVGSTRATIFACSDAGPLGMIFAATQPERVRALALANTTARFVVDYDYPIGLSAAELERRMSGIPENWGSEAAASREVPSRRHDPAFRHWYARYQRAAARPREVASYMPMVHTLDVRGVLSSIRCPTLVLHRRERGWIGMEHGRYIADRIPGARFIELPGADVMLATEYPEISLGLVEELVTGSATQAEPDRVLATVLFNDIVGSTERAATIGDRAWRDLLVGYHAIVRREVTRFRGRVIDTAGDGVLASFDGPARALRCAAELAGAVREIDVDVRTGVHTGECLIAGDKLAGIAVHVGARVMSHAGPGETLVSSTVKDLVAGSGITFVDRGTHVLKGVPGEWRLFQAGSSEPR